MRRELDSGKRLMLAALAAFPLERFMFWDESLSYLITPKSGPVRPMTTLHDARSALVHDLPPGATKRPHWLKAGMLLVAASESGSAQDIHAATEALVAALEVDGWMSPTTPRR